ncbi:MAG: DUF4388 domain-containing protein [Spirochaetia bacterium]|nr:DUF4388 domain-containing protein [Spirochaetia bacterium]
MHGTMSSISVAGMLRLLCSFGRSGELLIDSGRIKGKIVIDSGNIVSATAERTLFKTSGLRDTVVQLLLALEEGSFSFIELAPRNEKPSGIGIEDVILESAREIWKNPGNSVNIRDLIFPEDEVLRTTRLAAGREITVSFQADEWNLLAAFNGDSDIGTVLEDSGIERGKAEIILYGLTSAGLLRRLRFKIPELSKIAREELGNIGAAIVDSEFIRQKFDRKKMGMKNFVSLLNGLEASISEITGRTRAKVIIEKMWAATK